jgi:hypothetical protein
VSRLLGHSRHLGHTPGAVKLVLPPRQSRGVSRCRLGGRDVAQLGQGERPPVNYEYGMLTAKQRQQLVESAPV